MNVRKRVVSVEVESRELLLDVGPLSLEIQLRDRGMIWVYVKKTKDGGQGTIIPIGRLADALDQLVSKEFKRKDAI